MTTTPTVEQFLAEQSSEADVEIEHIDPLTSIADSLSRLADHFDAGQTFTAELASTDEQEGTWHQEYDDLYEKYNTALTVIHDVEAAIGKSTAKPSLAAKAVIDAWKSPVVPEPSDHISKAEREQMMADPGEQDVVYVCPHCKTGWGEVVDPCTECGRAASGERIILPAAPAHDADVAAWREFGQRMGIEGDLQQMNRSQIRTALGIEQLSA